MFIYVQRISYKRYLFNGDYLSISLSAQVALGTFFMKSPVVLQCQSQVTNLAFTSPSQCYGPTSTQNLCFQEENTVAVQLLNDNQYGCNALCFKYSITFDWAYHWWFRDGYRLGKASIKKIKKTFFRTCIKTGGGGQPPVRN